MVETERRKLKRFCPQDKAFAVLTDDCAKLGTIKDISKGGLAFEYITDGDQNKGSSEVDIFMYSSRFYLPRIPCKVIYDIEIVEEDQAYIPMPCIEIKRCGLQFGELTEVQETRLEFFLKQ